MDDRIDIVTAMHRIPRTVRDTSIAESTNVIDSRIKFARRTKMAEYIADDCA